MARKPFIGFLLFDGVETSPYSPENQIPLIQILHDPSLWVKGFKADGGHIIQDSAEARKIFLEYINEDQETHFVFNPIGAVYPVGFFSVKFNHEDETAIITHSFLDPKLWGKGFLTRSQFTILDVLFKFGWKTVSSLDENTSMTDDGEPEKASTVRIEDWPEIKADFEERTGQKVLSYQV